MKAKEIRDLTTEEIIARLKDEREQLLRLQLNHAVSSIESPSKIREARKTVARLHTILTQRQAVESISTH